MQPKQILLFFSLFIFHYSFSQNTYQNPIIHADYSDPDVIRVGQDYYMVASSFDAVPGIPILHSKDLVNWTIINHALPVQIPVEHFSKTQHGCGVWAPSIRYHNNQFYIYYPDPDFGIYVITAKNITDKFSEPTLVESGKGLEDPCPLWDDDGKAYLVHAFVGSRIGVKNYLVIKQLNADGTKVLDSGIMVYDAHGIETTVEGPKLYKRNGYYYIFAPAGGVSTGWQIVLRSKNIYGPYERKVVMQEGSSKVNGPHQGAWINTQTGEDWFIHFQDKGAYGRVVWLEPMTWKNDFPIIGEDKDNTGIGQPVHTYKKPNVGNTFQQQSPQTSDEFNEQKLGLQWQWQANPKQTWAYLYNGNLKLFAQTKNASTNLWETPNVLLQKFPAETFTATTKLNFKPNNNGDKISYVIMGKNYAALSIIQQNDSVFLCYDECINADKNSTEKQHIITQLKPNTDVYLRVVVEKNALCKFAYSLDNKTYTTLPQTFTSTAGKWIGAKLGFCCSSTTPTNDAAFVDIDWFSVE